MRSSSDEPSTEWSPTTDVTDDSGTRAEVRRFGDDQPMPTMPELVDTTQVDTTHADTTQDDITAQNHAEGIAAKSPQGLTAAVLHNRYRLGALIGQGVGRVYAARDIHLDEPCAIKVVVGERNCVRLQREVLFGQVCQKVPGLVRIRDRGDDPVEPLSYIVFDYLEGENLEQRLLRGPVPWPEALAIGHAAAQTLAGLHALGVIHRDIKPANLFLCRDGEVRVLDLGLALMPSLPGMTRDGALLGSPPFTSPEQMVHASEVDGRTDIYSMGLVLAYAMGGEAMLPSFGSDRHPMRLLDQARQRKPLASVEPQLPPKVVDLVERACQPDPAGRFATMAELAAALAQLIAWAETTSTLRRRPAPHQHASGALHRPAEREAHLAPKPKRSGWRRPALAALTVVGLVPWLLGAILLVKGVDLSRYLGVRRAKPRWHHALTLVQAGLTATAAKEFDQIATHADVHGREEAIQRAAALRRADAERRQAEAEAVAQGRALLSGGPLPLHLVARFPGHMRRAFYDAVRAAPDAQRVRALLPLGEALDHHTRSDILVPYLQRIATLPFARRAPLGRIYAKLALDYYTLSRQAQDNYFRELRAAHQDDLLMGALVLTDRVSDHLEEYRQLAEASGDPWFVIHALHEQALSEYRRGHDAQAERLFWTALDPCERQQVVYRCIQVELSLATFYRLRHKWVDAEDLARRAWKQAAETSSWQAELSSLSELRSIAAVRGDTLQAQAYLEEYRERDPKTCEQELELHVARADAALTALRFTDASRELQEAPRCGPPLGLKHLTILEHLDRLGMPLLQFGQLVSEIARARREGGLGPSDTALLAEIEGALLLRHQRADGLAQLQAVIAVTARLPGWNLNARAARAAAYEELIFDAAQHADLAGALRLVEESMDAGDASTHPSRPAAAPTPTAASAGKCTLAVLVSDERRLVLVRDARGQVRGQQTMQRSPHKESQDLVPPELQTVLLGCRQVEVDTPPGLRGDPRLLGPQIAWAYRAPRSQPLPPIGGDLLVVDVAPPVRMLPGLMEQAGKLPALAWLMQTTDPEATAGCGEPGFRPRSLLQRTAGSSSSLLDSGTLGLATTAPPCMVQSAEPLVPIPFHTRTRRIQGTKWRPAASELDGSYPLIATELAQRKLKDAPLVIWHAPSAALHAPADNLPSAYIAAGARAVVSVDAGLGSARPGPFLTRVLIRVHGGESLPEALRNERVLALKDGALWVKEVVAYE